jgi:hypothetical protein
MRKPDQSNDSIQGTWSATRWHYVGAADDQLARDVVCDLGATITLSLGANSYVLTFDEAGKRSIDGGVFVVAGETLELRSHNSDTIRSLRWRLVEETLTLRSEGTYYDFDDEHHDEPASFVAVLVRF